MYKNKKIISLIPARGGSKGIPRKNIRDLAGKPLIAYSIEQSISCELIDRTYVSTEDEEIAGISRKCGAEIIVRPPEFATDTAKTEDVVKHALTVIKEKSDIIVLLQPTSPLRKQKTIEMAITTFIDNMQKYDFLMPLHKAEPKRGKIENRIYVPEVKEETRRQDLDETFFECGTIFIYKSDLIRGKEKPMQKIMPFVIKSRIEALDIDSEEDFRLAENILLARK